MSIVVEGIYFPTSCANCKFHQVTEYSEPNFPTIYEVYCAITRKRLTWYEEYQNGLDRKRDNDCPLKRLDGET